jgi:hypothetical protein
VDYYELLSYLGESFWPVLKEYCQLFGKGLKSIGDLQDNVSRPMEILGEMLK